MQKDSNTWTFTFMLIVCLVCAVVVSGAATALKADQERNQQVFVQKNIFKAVGEDVDDQKGDAVAQRYEDEFVALVVDGNGEPVAGADPIQAMKTLNKTGAPKAFGQVKPSELELPLYVYKGASGTVENPEAYVVPIYGKGLWSTLRGFLALDKDGNTVRGITFYEHQETPGLGGEVDNPVWQAQWPGKTILEGNRLVSIEVLKGVSAEGNPHAVDGLSGATITSRGVQNFVKTNLDTYAAYFDKNVWQRDVKSTAPLDKTSTNG